MNETNLFKNLINNLDDHITEMDTPTTLTYSSVDSHFAIDQFLGTRIGNYGLVRFRMHCTTAVSSGGTSLNLITLNIEADGHTILGEYTHIRNGAFASKFFVSMSNKSIRQGGSNALQVNDYFIGWIIFHIG